MHRHIKREFAGMGKRVGAAICLLLASASLAPAWAEAPDPQATDKRICVQEWQKTRAEVEALMGRNLRMNASRIVDQCSEFWTLQEQKALAERVQPGYLKRAAERDAQRKRAVQSDADDALAARSGNSQGHGSMSSTSGFWSGGSALWTALRVAAWIGGLALLAALLALPFALLALVPLIRELNRQTEESNRLLRALLRTVKKFPTQFPTASPVPAQEVTRPAAAMPDQ